MIKIQTTMENWLKKNVRFLSIRAIEKELGCPSALQKSINGTQKLAQKWIKPLRDFAQKMNKEI